EYYEVRLEIVKTIGRIMTKKAIKLIEEEILKRDRKTQELFYDKLKKLLSEIGFRKDYIDQRKKEWLFEDFALSNKFWLVKIKEFISGIFGEQWISQNIEDSKIEAQLVRALNEQSNYRFKAKIKDILWNFGSEKTKSIFLDSELEKKISNYIDNKDANAIFSIIHNYHDLEGEKISYENILKLGMKGLEEIGTDEAIEKLLHFIRYTGGDYSGDESIYALHALDRIGTDDILQELYTKFLKGLVGIDNEFFIKHFVTIVGKHNLDLLLDIFSSPEEDFYLTPKKYNEDLLHLKSYIIDAFGTLKDPVCIEPLVNALVDSSYDTSIKEALIKINKPEETIGFLLEKYNYYTNLLYTLIGSIKYILRSLNISIIFTDFSSFADIKHFNFHLTRLEKLLSSVLDLDSISHLEDDVSIDSTILDRIKTSSDTLNPEEQLLKSLVSRFGKGGFTEFDYNLLGFMRNLRRIVQENKYNSDKATEEILLECYEQEEILSYLFSSLLAVKSITHRLALALVKFGFKDLSEDDVTDIVDHNIVREMLHSSDNDN
ncbi:MAG: hypothetical protein KAR08_03350, partial [Candidatus Heimdallarchaeota archaeon]|nr:hypothetical protein [Candidatus Heimdallarchaeota archaeon]